MRHFRLMADQGTTVVMTTHLLAHVNLLDKIAICAQGNLVFFGTPREALAFFGETDTPLTDPIRIFERLIGVENAVSSENQLACARQFADRITSYNVCYTKLLRPFPLLHFYFLNYIIVSTKLFIIAAY